MRTFGVVYRVRTACFDSSGTFLESGGISRTARAQFRARVGIKCTRKSVLVILFIHLRILHGWIRLLR